MAKLNSRQQEAVHYIDGVCLVLAGAGSGKTSVITQKIAYLIQECGYQARNIAALTFTNKAAREMKSRVAKLVKGKKSHGLTVSTFHNLGLTIIRRECAVLGYKSSFSIFDSEDSRALIKELMLRDGDLDTDLLDTLQHQISHWKSSLIEPEQAADMAQSDAEKIWALVYQRYNQALKAYNAVDFDDLIRLPILLFQKNDVILERWRHKIRYLLVDEYQDTNSSQYHLVKLLVGNRHALTVVGDDDQSIYAWRGARPENLSLLKTDFPGIHVIKLEQNYRSTARILKAANTLIANNPHEFNKTLWSELGQGDAIQVLRCPSEDAEAERVATEILTQKLRGGRKFKDFAVLYRGNHQSRLVEIKLQHHQVPYNISGGTGFFSRAEIKDMMAYLRLLVNPDDDNAFLRIVNTPRRSIGTSTLESLGHFANDHNLSLLSACSHASLGNTLSEKSAQRVLAFSEWIDKVRQNCHENDSVSAIRSMLDDIDYEAWLHQNASSPKVAESRMGNVWMLLDSIKQTMERNDDNHSDNQDKLNDAIAKLVLRDLLDRQEEEDEGDRVQLMTLHASKGLEFPNVFLMGFEEALLPHRNSIDDNNIEEERRLTYVGITRAKRQLTISLAATRKQFGEKQSTTVSRFLDELPREDLELEGFGKASAEDVKKKKEETLSSLMKMFDE